MNPQPDLPQSNEIHIWKVDLNSISPLPPVLSEDERERGSRFKRSIHRDRFEYGRSTLRIILGAYLRCPPARLRFAYTEFGKPSLDTDKDDTCLYFNLSHSESNMLIAFSTTAEIGVDIEFKRHLSDEGDLVKRFFSKAEQNEYSQLPETLRTQGFFNAWTRKEAIVKASGLGLQTPLDSFSVSLGPEVPCSILEMQNSSFNNPAKWSLFALETNKDCTAAIASPAKITSIQTFEFSDFTSN